MKSLKLTASEINGNVKAPASKSMLQRALAAAMLDGTQSRIVNITLSNDARAAVNVISGLGAQVEMRDDEIRVSGPMKPIHTELSCGESGLGIRMFTPVAALNDVRLVITGEGSLLSRPVDMMAAPLTDLGVRFSSNNGFPPLTVTGPLQGGETTVNGALSSQFLTGLLMALPKATRNSRLRVIDLKSIPYIDMTLSFLERCGIVVENLDYREFHIPGNQVYRLGDYEVEGDWSGAAFPLTAGALGGEAEVTGLNPCSAQADRRILEALTLAGAHVVIRENSVIVRRDRLNAFDFDATHCPDLFPPLTALACGCVGRSRLYGVGRLIHKESNRAKTLEKEFSALGARIKTDSGSAGDFMEIEGGGLHGGTIDSHNDHRISMAGALASILAEEPITILDPDCADKSYPGFFTHFTQLGGVIYHE